MRRMRLSSGLAVAVFSVMLLVTGARAAAQGERVLHSFGGGKDGNQPIGSLIFDASGNLYGTTIEGGAFGGGLAGIAFELSPKAGGGWTEKVLHNFGHGLDGSRPLAGLVIDAESNLYGTTTEGGAYGEGTAFELSPKAGGGWTEKVLHSFGHGQDGSVPDAGLIFDAAGNLYGTTSGGGTGTNCGAAACGIVFELSPKATGGWFEKVLHSFNGNAVEGTFGDGADPVAGLTFDAAGNLYGTTYVGGFVYCLEYVGGPYGGCGTVFELSPAGDGTWTEKVIDYFTPGDGLGQNPEAGVIFDASGNLYGTALYGGIIGYGTVYELTPGSSGNWTGTVLHNFDYNGTDGANPGAGLILDRAGNLYGTTWFGGTDTNGIAFELMPQGGGSWTEMVLHNFNSNANDGQIPRSSLTFDATGNLYGTTAIGGGDDAGTVFEIAH
jgi:uncharacterized repeat protein (TIGR03803 family)